MPRAPKQELRNWQKEVADAAEAARATEESAGSSKAWLSTKGGKLSVDGAEIPGSSLEVVILDHVLENQFFALPFDPAVPASPDCYAFGRDATELAPHEGATSPQHEACKGCPKSAWGSGDRGKGKACKEVRRLALIAADDLDDIENAEVRYLKVPVMSAKNWSGYVRHLADVMHLPPFCVITKLSVTSENMVTVSFQYLDKVDESAIPALLDKRAAIQTDLVAAYPIIEAPAPSPKTARYARRG